MTNTASKMYTVPERPTVTKPVEGYHVALGTTGADKLIHTPDDDKSIYCKGLFGAEASASNLSFKQRSPVLEGTVSTVKGSLELTVNASTDVWTANDDHGLVAGQPVVLENSGGALPTGTAAATVYYAAPQTDTTFLLYETEEDALEDDGETGLIDAEDTGTGTHSFNGRYVFGTGTGFETDYADLPPGSAIVIEDGSTLVISSVVDDETIIAAAEAGSTVSGKEHQRQETIVVPELAAGQLLSQKVAFGEWLFAAKVGWSLVANASTAISSLLVHLQEGKP